MSLIRTRGGRGLGKLDGVNDSRGEVFLRSQEDTHHLEQRVDDTKEYENITKIEYEYHNNNQTAGSRNSTNVPRTNVQGTLLYSLTPW